MGRPPLTIEEMQEIAERRGGRCLSKIYKRANIKLEWECSKGHKWRAVPANVKHGTWCPFCAGNSILTIQEMQKIAKSHGGRCLSKTYDGVFVKLHWECSNKHRFWADPGPIINRGVWCPECGRIKKRLTLERTQEIAELRGGRCLSTAYKDIDSKLKWQCSKGHKWETTPRNVKRGTWCPTCAGKK